MKKLTRILTALLVLAMILPMALACAETSSEGETTAAAITEAPTGSEVVTEPEETLFVPSNIPEDLRFDGVTINILHRNDSNKNEFFVED